MCSQRKKLKDKKISERLPISLRMWKNCDIVIFTALPLTPCQLFRAQQHNSHFEILDQFSVLKSIHQTCIYMSDKSLDLKVSEDSTQSHYPSYMWPMPFPDTLNFGQLGIQRLFYLPVTPGVTPTVSSSLPASMGSWNLRGGHFPPQCLLMYCLFLIVTSAPGMQWRLECLRCPWEASPVYLCQFPVQCDQTSCQGAAEGIGRIDNGVEWFNASHSPCLRWVACRTPVLLENRHQASLHNFRQLVRSRRLLLSQLQNLLLLPCLQRAVVPVPRVGTSKQDKGQIQWRYS